MVTGIEAIGLSLAILPLLVNQLDGYVRGIEKIKVLRRYRTEFALYSRALTTQKTILLNTLEEALSAALTNSNHEISELIRSPQGEAWKDPALQNRLRQKLDRNYDVFVDNVVGLFELLDRFSRKLEINVTDTKVRSTSTVLYLVLLAVVVPKKSPWPRD